MLHFLLKILGVVLSYFCRKQENENGEEIWKAVKHSVAVDNCRIICLSLKKYVSWPVPIIVIWQAQKEKMK